MAAHAGFQSAGQPSSLCRSPASVTLVYAGFGSAVAYVPTGVPHPRAYESAYAG